MNTQFDWNKRVVALSNLEAMCERISGWSHRFEVTKVSRSRVHVTYSNPNEYGSPNPMTAVFPCYPATNESDNPAVVLDILRVVNDSWNGEGWQAFQQLLDCPTLWRGPVNGGDSGWRSHSEIRAAGSDNRIDLPDTCVKCDLV